MKADISTLHKPDILILRRQANPRTCQNLVSDLAFYNKNPSMDVIDDTFGVEPK
jgi:hypothetical protein